MDKKARKYGRIFWFLQTILRVIKHGYLISDLEILAGLIKSMPSYASQHTTVVANTLILTYTLNQ